MAGLLDLPRQQRQLPDTLDRAQVEALLDAPDAATSDGLRERALLELLYACGLRISEALRLDVDDLSLREATVRVIGKGDRERMLPVGAVAIEVLGRYLETARPPLLERAVARDPRAARRGGPLFLSVQGRRLSRMSAWRGLRRAALTRRQRPRHAAYAAPFFCDTLAGRRSGPARRAGIARPRQHHHHTAVHAPDRGEDQAGLRAGSPPCLMEEGPCDLRRQTAGRWRARRPAPAPTLDVARTRLDPRLVAVAPCDRPAGDRPDLQPLEQRCQRGCSGSHRRVWRWPDHHPLAVPVVADRGIPRHQPPPDEGQRRGQQALG